MNGEKPIRVVLFVQDADQLYELFHLATGRHAEHVARESRARRRDGDDPAVHVANVKKWADLVDQIAKVYNPLLSSGEQMENKK